MASPTTANREANLFAHYLIRRVPTSQQTELYQAASSRINAPAKKSLQAALSSPLLLPYLDAHDAFFRPNSELRQRLYLMFSILEASPAFTDQFLPQKRSPWYMAAIAWYGCRGVFRLVVGTIIVKVRGL